MGFRVRPAPWDDEGFQRYMRVGRLQAWLGLVCIVAFVLTVGSFLLLYAMRL